MRLMRVRRTPGNDQSMSRRMRTPMVALTMRRGDCNKSGEENEDEIEKYDDDDNEILH